MTFRHMPFMASDRLLLYCTSPGPTSVQLRHKSLAPSAKLPDPHHYCAWKMQWSNPLTGAGGRVETGLPPFSVECCPTATESGGVWTISFVAGMLSLTESVTWSLYEMTTTDWVSFSAPRAVASARSGFSSPSMLAVLGEKSQVGMVDRVLSRSISVQTGFDYIYSIGFRADAPRTLILTGHMDSGPRSLAMDIDKGESLEILGPSGGVYKCSVLGDSVTHALKSGQGFEERDIVTEQVGYGPPPVQAWISHGGKNA